jgi:hypothetical protein
MASARRADSTDSHTPCTVGGRTVVLRQQNEVERFHEPNDGGEVAEVWYDLNLDRVKSDLTATIRLVRTPDSLILRLYDIHVM